MSFKPEVSKFDENGIKLSLNFDDPVQLSLKDQGEFSFIIKEVSIFVSHSGV